MMRYNYSFLIAGLVILVLIFLHYSRQKLLDSRNNKVFRFFIIVGILDILFDIISTYLMTQNDPDLIIPAVTTLTCLYLIQTMLLFSFLCYSESLSIISVKNFRRNIIIGGIPCIILGLSVIFNAFFGYFFYFDSTGHYFRGMYYLVMYVFSLFYILIILCRTVSKRNEIKKSNIIASVEFFMFLVVGLIIQSMLEGILLVGFVISLGILILYFTASNPLTQKDSLSDTFDRASFLNLVSNNSDRMSDFYFISLDITNLKQINQIYSNNTGDKLVISTVKRIMVSSKTNKIFRLNGNRFAVIFDSELFYSDALLNLKKTLSAPFEINEEKIYINCIICGIPCGSNLKDADMLLSYMEFMVSKSEDSTGITTILSKDDIFKRFIYEQRVEHYIPEAVEKNLFELHYQPIYSIASGKYVAFEALSRLRHPELGMIPPDLFITSAERSGKIDDIGCLQFNNLCRFLKENPEIRSKIKNIKFNLSPLELLKKGYARTLINTIDSYGLPHETIQFEITETVATEYTRELRDSVTEFKNAGCSLCLDDFGAGYANLNTVLKLPFSVIKLDRSLLSGICTDRRAADFYRSTVSLFHDLGYVIISEGVDSKEEVDLLKKWNVDYIQGYYFSKPLCESDLLKL